MDAIPKQDYAGRTFSFVLPPHIQRRLRPQFFAWSPISFLVPSVPEVPLVLLGTPPLADFLFRSVVFVAPKDSHPFALFWVLISNPFRPVIAQGTSMMRAKRCKPFPSFHSPLFDLTGW